MQQLKQAFGWDDFPAGPLFYEARFALRFDLGGAHKMGIARFTQAIDRARAVASLLFADSDVLTVAVPYFGRRAASPVPAIIKRALNETGFSGTIESTRRMPPRDENDAENDAEGLHRHLCVLEMSNRPDQVLPFIWASVANEMPIEPRFCCLSRAYVMDLKQGLILYPYDDRGMDVVARDPVLLRPCYDQFGDWLLDHDRIQMDAIFASAL
ncbi:DUF3885 domain-containing protein [Rhodobacter sp.]